MCSSNIIMFEVVSLIFCTQCKQVVTKVVGELFYLSRFWNDLEYLTAINGKNS